MTYLYNSIKPSWVLSSHIWWYIAPFNSRLSSKICACAALCNCVVSVIVKTNPGSQDQRPKHRSFPDCVTLTTVYSCCLPFKKKVLTFVSLGCPPHWKNFTDKCYYFSVEKDIFDDAKLFCEDKSSHLVFINTREEQVCFGTLKKNYNLRIVYIWKLHAC